MASQSRNVPGLVDSTEHHPYSHCKTSILDLRSFDLPSNLSANDSVLQWYRKTHGLLSHTAQGAELEHIALTLRVGLAPPVAFPTETVYGLGADATRSDAVQSIFAAKQRPSDNPLIVHVATLTQLQTIFGRELPEHYQKLVAKFWPGPLTILLPLPEHNPIAPEVSCGLSTVGVRMPANPLARLFIELVDRPLAAPSANASTRPSPTTAQHVMEDMNGRINFILDGGSCSVGLESTVIDGLCEPPEILRPGGISLEQIRAVGVIWAKTVMNHQLRDKDNVDSEEKSCTNGDTLRKDGPRAPGMMYKHYSPRARVLLFRPERSVDDVVSYIEEEAISSLAPGMAIGIISTNDWTLFCGMLVSPVPIEPQISDEAIGLPTKLLSAGRMQIGPGRPGISVYQIHLPTVSSLGKYLFASLRAMDHLGCGVILVEGIDDVEVIANGDTKEDLVLPSQEEHLAAAIMNRLRKAAEIEI